MNKAVSDSAAERGHKLILSSRVEGTSVYSKNGDAIGHIDDLSIERTSGKVVYAIMSFGGFLGIGEKFHPIPWSLLDFDPERGGYAVPLDKAELKDAPHYGREELVAQRIPRTRLPVSHSAPPHAERRARRRPRPLR